MLMKSKLSSFKSSEWDLSSEYESVHSEIFQSDFKSSKENIKVINHLSTRLYQLETFDKKVVNQVKVDIFIKIYQVARINFDILRNLSVYLSCSFSVDTKNKKIKSYLDSVEDLILEFKSSLVIFNRVIILSSKIFIERVLDSSEIKNERFTFMHLREQKDYLLSDEKEDSLLKMKKYGLNAWGDIYNVISGKIECCISNGGNQKNVGISQATELLSSPNRRVREEAFLAINHSWGKYGEVCQSALNAMVGWRLEEYKMRSLEKEKNFIEHACYENHMQVQSLDKMLIHVKQSIPIGRKALSLKAKFLGTKDLAPWDLFAPAPKLQDTKNKSYGFDEAIEIVAESFSTLHDDFKDFVYYMKKNKWIEAQVLPNKLPGAFCKVFPKSRTPRVYMTFSGTLFNILILAHELGHAFHSYIMRDCPRTLIDYPFGLDYPLTLAETASIFSENLLVDFIVEKSSSRDEILSILWEDLEAVSAYLLNIPIRFYFEKTVYERRQKTVLSEKDFSKIMENSWSEFYGDVLSGYDKNFWMSKLHFYMTDTTFYNFPYTFGYFFSLYLHDHRRKNKEMFFEKYKMILKDTGRMKIEDLILKHFDHDIQKSDFWNVSLNVIENKIKRFEKLCF